MKWVPVASSRWSSPPRDQTRVFAPPPLQADSLLLSHWINLESTFNFLLYAKQSKLQMHLCILKMTPINLLIMVQRISKRKIITRPSVIWSPSPSWIADQFKDIHLFFCARRVWTFHCILIHVSPLFYCHITCQIWTLYPKVLFPYIAMWRFC